MKNERFDWTVLGRVIGTATGWDQIDTNSIVFYEYSPADGVPLPKGDLCFEMESGFFQLYDENGICTQAIDAVTALANVARKADL